MMNSAFNPLSLDTLKRLVPCVFTETNAQRTSDKYQHISTLTLIEALAREGFVPVWAARSRCRDHNKIPHTKHLLRFRHQDARPTPAGLYPELVLVNSHDGLSSYRLMSGIYRVVCANGLIAGDSFAQVRIRHQGEIVKEVIEGSFEVIKNAQGMIEHSEQMSHVQLNDDAQRHFALTAHALRFEGSTTGEAFQPARLLMARRLDEFKKTDLFTIFNVVQENLIKGGFSGAQRDQRGRLRNIRARAITGIDQSIALNRSLWQLAESMM